LIAERLISRLDKVKSTGNGKWVACCPAHEDKTPSLSVTEISDRVLIKCWTGCSASEIVEAVGLTLSDLFPEHIPSIGHQPAKDAWSARQILECLKKDFMMMNLIAYDLHKGKPLDNEMQSQLESCTKRFYGAVNG